MTRAELKELLDSKSPQSVSADMYADPLLRSMERVRARADKRYRDDLLALYADRSLTDEQLLKRMGVLKRSPVRSGGRRAAGRAK